MTALEARRGFHGLLAVSRIAPGPHPAAAIPDLTRRPPVAISQRGEYFIIWRYRNIFGRIAPDLMRN
jgi:hypothetical protein